MSASARASHAGIGSLAISCLLASLLAALLLNVGCGFIVARRRVARLPSAPMLSASLPQLVDGFNREANAVQSMKLKLALTGSNGGPRSGTVSQLKWNITTFLLIEKPGRIRLFGEVSLLGRVFDMASDGSQFEVSLPTMDRFLFGPAQAVTHAVGSPVAAPVVTPVADLGKVGGGLQNLRPGVILDAMLINPIETAAGQHVMFINDRAETAAEYGVLVVLPSPDGYDHLLRRIVFSRYNLLPSRQIIYDPQTGLPATQATYERYVIVHDIPVPTHITITRPEEEYALDLTVQPDGITLNPPPMPPATWRLTPPAGARLTDLSASH